MNLSRRDLLAGMAMHAIITRGVKTEVGENAAMRMVPDAVTAADILIAELDKTTVSPSHS